MTTQKDIAEYLGVSVTTISLALRGDSQISDEMQARVHNVAARLEYNYRPRKRTNAKIQRIAYIAANNVSGTGAFYSTILHGAEQEANKQDIILSFVQLQENTINQGLIIEQEVDGILLVGAMREDVVRYFQQLDVPMVLVNNNLPQANLDRVLIENTYSVYNSVKQLAAWGHRRIAAIYGSLRHTSFAERLSGYREALYDLGLEANELTIGVDVISLEDAEHTVTAHLHNHGLNFTALVACCDQVAIGAMRALHEFGARIPEDVSVIGFDDIEAARLVSPALTTNHVHRKLLGALGIRTLLRRIEHPERPTTAQTVDTTFIVRDSAGPIQRVSVPETVLSLSEAQLFPQPDVHISV